MASQNTMADPATTATTSIESTPNVHLPPVLASSLPWPHFEDPSGVRVPMAALGRRPLALFAFSALWCAPCRALAPSIAKLHEMHADKDVAVVQVGLEYTRAEHNTLVEEMPYFRFGWEAPLPAPLPAGCENPFWYSMWSTVRQLGKVGIPTAVVVDTRTGQIVESCADLALRGQTDPEAIARVVNQWLQGRSASTWWMRLKYQFATWFYIQRARAWRFITNLLMAPVRLFIKAAPAPSAPAPIEEVDEDEHEGENEPVLSRKAELEASDSAVEVTEATPLLRRSGAAADDSEPYGMAPTTAE
ncbi:hypothetical protein AMAG_05530 [Allomyces macrogynus ATCC 38327]|uniref:Thioredoxin domain-containing protein n=1 Tax=Allomyces macrogynus (strain ATCC 38327) TaxID=578462 RepID=A0A0L0SCJ0_ALLM3|nr:hypothetical protein AMAG_05530 [Allomyces macrogynus ATCC 38327]|eukprot:KNE60105.1 hypothetical protein AMAG_05530 [Allomyces macrogynus ATCC 38327]